MALPLPVQDPEPPPPAHPAPDIATLAAIDLNFFRAKNERLILLLNFLQTPLQAPRDEEGRLDDNVQSAHNLATTAALQCIRSFCSPDVRR